MICQLREAGTTCDYKPARVGIGYQYHSRLAAMAPIVFHANFCEPPAWSNFILPTGNVPTSIGQSQIAKSGQAGPGREPPSATLVGLGFAVGRHARQLSVRERTDQPI